MQALDAPVSGGDVGAREATLVIMVGGDAEAFERARPLFEVLGRMAVHEGGPGAGQHTKMVNQIAIAGGMIGVCEALLYAHRAGLDVETVLGTISGGAAGSWSLSNLAPRALRGDFAPGFKVDHFIKDLGIALAEARRMDLALPGLALAEQLYVATRGAGPRAARHARAAARARRALGGAVAGAGRRPGLTRAAGRRLAAAAERRPCDHPLPRTPPSNADCAPQRLPAPVACAMNAATSGESSPVRAIASSSASGAPVTGR